MGKTNPKYFKQIQEYNKKNYRRVTLRYRLDDEEDIKILKWIDSLESVNKSIKDIIYEAYSKIENI